MKKRDREEVYKKTDGKCAYCGTQLQKGWHVDHLEPVYRESKRVAAPPGSRHTHVMKTTGMLYRPENDTIDNMLPACQRCNNYKNSYPLEYFRSMVADWERKAIKESVNYRNAKRFGLVNPVQVPVVFYFEKIGLEVGKKSS